MSVSQPRSSACFAGLGRLLIGAFAEVGRVASFGGKTIWRALTPPYYPGRLLQQLGSLGWQSLPVVGLTAIFTGAALAQQIYTAGSRFSAQSTVPAVVVIGMVRELGPVLVGLMVAGRARPRRWPPNSAPCASPNSSTPW